MLPTAASRCYPWDCFENCGRNLGINGSIQITKAIFSDKYGCNLHNFSKLLTYIVWTYWYKFPHPFINNIWIPHTHYAPVSEIIHFLQISSCSLDIFCTSATATLTCFTCIQTQTQTQTEFYSTSIEITSITSGCKNQHGGKPKID